MNIQQSVYVRILTLYFRVFFVVLNLITLKKLHLVIDIFKFTNYKKSNIFIIINFINFVNNHKKV